MAPPPPMPKPALLVCGAILGLLVACDRGPASDGTGAFPPPVVEVFEVVSQPLTLTADIPGQLAAEMSVELKSEIDGVVAAIAFEEGQRVEKDQVLFRLRNHEQMAVLREAEASLDLAEAVYKRTKILAARDVSSAAQLDSAQAELAVARARVSRVRVELDRTTIRAPFDGLVGARQVDVGDRVDSDTALVRLDALDRLQLLFSVVESYSARVRPGIPVQIRVAPYPDELFDGVVFFVSPTLDPALRRLPIKAWVPNPDHRLRPGLFADIQARLAERTDAILIPESALLYGLEGPFVWRVDGDNRAHRTPVEVGFRRDGEAEITHGLSPGDVVVSAGVHKVADGAPITPASGPPPETTAGAGRDELES